MSDRNVAVVTGGSRGIGRAVAIQLAKSGNDVAVIYRGNKEKAEEVVDIIKSFGVDAISIQADVSSSSDCKEAISKVKEAFGKVNILVNNAGIAPSKFFVNIDDAEWNKIYHINLKGNYFLTQAWVRMWKKTAF